jgi:hypothetical protein
MKDCNPYFSVNNMFSSLIVWIFNVKSHRLLIVLRILLGFNKSKIKLTLLKEIALLIQLETEEISGRVEPKSICQFKK